MIYVSNLRSMQLLEAPVKWAIVRSYKNPLRGITQMVDLSPTKELFGKYLQWKSQGVWNHDTFRNLYVPEFMETTIATEAAMKALKLIRTMDTNGTGIAIGCFCENENMCHRAVVGGILEGLGCDVRYPREVSHIEFYEEYKNKFTL